MKSVTESDIKELKNLINQRFDDLKFSFNEVDKRLTVIEKDVTDVKKEVIEVKKEVTEVKKEVTDVKIGQGEIKGKLAGVELNVQKVPDLAEKVGELKNWKQVGLIVITAFLSSILSGTIGWLLRGASFRP
jgi:septation ring formation regulator EzrA